MTRIAKFTKAYTRHYTDNDQITTYVEWVDTKGVSGRTEGSLSNEHMQALVRAAGLEGVPLQQETW